VRRRSPTTTATLLIAIALAAGAGARAADQEGDGGLLVSSRGRVVFPPAQAPSEIESPSSTGRIATMDGRLRRADGELVQGDAALTPASARIGLESILGSDDRREVKDTATYPARAVVLITFGNMRCTGALVGPDTVLTAGHCIYDHSTLAFFDPLDYRVYPGRDGKRAPFGSCGVEETMTSAGYVERADDRYDYGLLLLDCTIGDDVGWFGLYAKAGSVKKTQVHISGYPGDKPRTQWTSGGAVTVSQSRRVFYKNDTTGGTSGAGVYFYGSRQCDPCILGVHAYGLYGEPPYSENNHAARVTPEVVEMIMEIAGH
jgi:glutamyl endopeptidase